MGRALTGRSVRRLARRQSRSAGGAGLGRPGDALRDHHQASSQRCSGQNGCHGTEGTQFLHQTPFPHCFRRLRGQCRWLSLLAPAAGSTMPPPRASPGADRPGSTRVSTSAGSRGPRRSTSSRASRADRRSIESAVPSGPCLRFLPRLAALPTVCHRSLGGPGLDLRQRVERTPTASVYRHGRPFLRSGSDVHRNRV